MARIRKVHWARRGCLEASGYTKTEAKAELDKRVDWACQYNPLHVETYLGWVIVIAPNSYGYSSMAFDPTEGNKVHSYRTFCGREPIEREIQRQRLHVAQLTWKPEMTDTAHLYDAGFGLLTDDSRVELASWIKFQRLHAAHKAAGATDNEAHERACRGEPVEA